MKTNELIEELKNHDEMTIHEIAEFLECDTIQAYSMISSINSHRKWIELGIKIIKTGKYGNSKYSLVIDDTEPNDILKNINSYIKRSLNAIRRQRELGIVGINTRQTQELKTEFTQLVAQTSKMLHEQWTNISYGLEVNEDKRKKKRKNREEEIII